MLVTPIFSTPNLHDYAQYICAGNNCNVLREEIKVWKGPKLVKTSINSTVIGTVWIIGIFLFPITSLVEPQAYLKSEVFNNKLQKLLYILRSKSARGFKDNLHLQFDSISCQF